MGGTLRLHLSTPAIPHHDPPAITSRTMARDGGTRSVQEAIFPIKSRSNRVLLRPQKRTPTTTAVPASQKRFPAAELQNGSSGSTTWHIFWRCKSDEDRRTKRWLLSFFPVSPVCVLTCPFRPAKVVFTPQTVSGGRVVLCCNVIKHTRSIDPIKFIHVALITTCLYCSRRLFQVSLAKTQKLVPLDGGINGGRAPRYVTQSAPIEHYIMMQWESLCAA